MSGYIDADQMTFVFWVVLAVAALCNCLLGISMIVSAVHHRGIGGVSCADATKLDVLMIPLGLVTFFIDAVALVSGVALVLVFRDATAEWIIAVALSVPLGLIVLGLLFYGFGWLIDLTRSRLKK
jgi:hypothetical protein